MSRKLDRIIAYVQRTPWAILESQGDVIASILTRRSHGERLTRAQIRALIDDGQGNVEAHEAMAGRLTAQSGGSVAVIPVVGTIMHRAGAMDDVSGIVSTQTLVSRVRAAQADPAVKSIVLDIDSPGGSVDGVTEAAAALREGSKPVVAVANTMTASAAYWLASQADEIAVSPSSEVGSIGVFTIHADVSEQLAADGVRVEVIRAGKFKAESNPFEPLTQDARDEIQSQVDAHYATFVADVAKGRGTSVKAVRSGFGQGRMVRAKDAVAAGMADRVATLDATVQRMSGGGRVRKRNRADEAPAAVESEATDEIEIRRRRLAY